MLIYLEHSCRVFDRCAIVLLPIPGLYINQAAPAIKEFMINWRKKLIEVCDQCYGRSVYHAGM